MTTSSKFYDHLCQQYPALAKLNSANLVGQNLLSPHQVKLSPDILRQIQDCLQTFESLRQLPGYQKWIERRWGPQFQPGNQGLFMSYDFHVSADQTLKLIEINTNASFLALGWEMSKFHGVPWNANFHINDLKACFENELTLAGKKGPLHKILIADEHPETQKLFIEFLVYQELFRSWGVESEICDVEKIVPCDIIYNRSTDFYFESSRSANLKSCYENRDSVVSPNPMEYRLLADKENFIYWTDPTFWSDLPEAEHLKEKVLRYLPKTELLNSNNRDDVWARRKGLFFKPKRAFGSKMTFKGANISRKIFEELVTAESLAQEAIPAPELPFADQTFKFDLRCFAYQGHFQGCVARLYQGQVTNLRTEGGGFSVVTF